MSESRSTVSDVRAVEGRPNLPWQADLTVEGLWKKLWITGSNCRRHSFELTLAASEEDLAIAAWLEQRIFANHEPASESELRTIARKGALLLLRSSGVPSGILALLLQPSLDLGHLQSLLPSDTAFLETVGLTRPARGYGLQLALVEVAEWLARLSGKQRICTAVRGGNGASLHQFFKSGYLLVAFDASFYGHRPGSGRFILEHDLRMADPLDRGLPAGPTITRHTRWLGDSVCVFINDGDQPDRRAQKTAAGLLSDGYVGVHLQKSPMQGVNVLTFVPISSLESKARAIVAARRAWLTSAYSIPMT
jgi:hypothetical protein